VRWTVVAWWMDVVVWVIVGKKTHEAFHVSRTDGQKLLPSEGGSLTAAVELDRVAIQELHKPADVGVACLLARHDPAGVIVGVVMVGLK